MIDIPDRGAEIVTRASGSLFHDSGSSRLVEGYKSDCRIRGMSPGSIPR
jgi:hypothetical protein